MNSRLAGAVAFDTLKEDRHVILSHSKARFRATAEPASSQHGPGLEDSYWQTCILAELMLAIAKSGDEDREKDEEYHDARITPSVLTTTPLEGQQQASD